MSKRLSFLAAAVLTAFAVTGCYNDSAIKTDIADLQSRVKTLEDQMLTANNNISALQDLVKALNGKVLVESVEENSDGWVIKFSNGKTVTVSKGSGPKISAKKDADGIYYWTLDGEWLLGEGGEKLAVTGAAPQLKIEGDYWYISTDGGATWTQLSKAKGDQGGPGDSIFQWVNQDESYWYFALANGDIISIGRGIYGAKAVNVIPSFSDGSVIANKGKFTMSFDVLPAEAAEGLAEESNDIFNVKVVYTAPTKASNSISLPILSKEGKEGVLLLTVDGSGLDDSFVNGTSGASACLQIVWNDNIMSSGYFTLTYYDPYNGHEYVDLGLPSGLKWATMNIGAKDPEDPGDFFAWGETVAKPVDSWETWLNSYNTWDDTYKWGTKENLTKYNSIDGLEQLLPENDAAVSHWGGSWRMPTKEEIKELGKYCTLKTIEVNGKYGVRFTGPNGNQIFMHYSDEYAGNDGFTLIYSSTCRLDCYSYGIRYNSNNRHWGGPLFEIPRCALLHIRPVCE